jgi:hypothetical protein
MPEGAGSIGISPCTRQSQGRLDSGNAHGQGRLHSEKTIIFSSFSYDRYLADMWQM